MWHWRCGQELCFPDGTCVTWRRAVCAPGSAPWPLVPLWQSLQVSGNLPDQARGAPSPPPPLPSLDPPWQHCPLKQSLGWEVLEVLLVATGSCGCLSRGPTRGRCSRACAEAWGGVAGVRKGYQACFPCLCWPTSVRDRKSRAK